MLRCFTHAASRLAELVTAQLSEALGQLQPRQIVLKPNWVMHEREAAFPIAALVTDARLIGATARACCELFPRAESITVGDCPLQSADWPLLCRQSGLTQVMDELDRTHRGRVVFRDLRKDVFEVKDSFMTGSTAEHGDPRGYREVRLGACSHLEPISDQAHKFAVNDYSAAVTRSNHRRRDHRYLVSQTILDADLLINLPKWKTHQKAGITCALKNLVGINGDKAYLPHFRRGAPKWGGDEYWDRGRWVYWLQTTLRESLQKRSALAFRALKPGWEVLKRLRGIETRFDNPQAAPRNFYVGGGGWHGNQTIWRMIYDLNLVIQRADAQGRLQPTPQRHCFSVVDGLVCGEGNGPLSPLPRPVDWVIFGEDPFAIDTALAWFMGFDPERIPVLAQRAEYLGPAWGDFEARDLQVFVDGHETRLVDTSQNFKFTPPPGWIGHIEREH